MMHAMKYDFTSATSTLLLVYVLSYNIFKNAKQNKRMYSYLGKNKGTCNTPAVDLGFAFFFKWAKS